MGDNLAFRATVEESAGSMAVVVYYELLVDSAGGWVRFERREQGKPPTAYTSAKRIEGVRAVEFFDHAGGAPILDLRIDSLGRENSFIEPWGPQALKVNLELICPWRWTIFLSRPAAFAPEISFQIGSGGQVTSGGSVTWHDIYIGQAIGNAGAPPYQEARRDVRMLGNLRALVFRPARDERPFELFPCSGPNGRAVELSREDYSGLDANKDFLTSSISMAFERPSGQPLALVYRRACSLTTNDPRSVVRVRDDADRVYVLRRADFENDELVLKLRQIVDRRADQSNDSRWTMTIGTLRGDGAAGLLCGYWNSTVADRYHGALKSIQDASDLSLVPVLKPADGLPNTAYKAYVEFGVECSVFFDPKQPGSWIFERRYRVLPQGATAGMSLPVDATFSQLTTRTGEALSLRWDMKLRGDWLAPTSTTRTEDRQPRFDFALAGKAGGPGAGFVRIGALDLEFDADQTGQELSFADCRLVADGYTGEGDYLRAYLRGEIDGMLKLGSLQPGSQDALPDEFRAKLLSARSQAGTQPYDPDLEHELEKALDHQPPLVFRRDEDRQSPADLKVREILRDESERGLAMEVRRRRTGLPHQGTERTIVLDSMPFIAAQVEYPLLTGADSTEDVGGAVANWSESDLEGAKWEIAGITDGFVLTLPPQSVGEAMEKGTGYGALEKGKPVDFRFSPPARLKVVSSYYRQRYAEAPWNLRRVLGYPGQRAPGAGLKSLRMELLYGMSVFVEGREPLRIAEVSARLGALNDAGDPYPVADLPAMLGPSHEQAYPVWNELRRRWARTIGAYRRRLAVLEPWSERRPDGALTLAEGVTYLLRAQGDRPHEAHTADPINPQTAQPNTLPRLRGGALWGFESQNILDSVLRDRVSDDGLLARPYLSALGGWGYQRASFDRKRTRIYSDTAMGRTFYYSVERVGRIGALWNRAKHVIVYERSVLPSDQFGDQQEPHIGRLVLRKVKEFVEILQPVRSYPEAGEGEIVRGFVRASEFKQTRIPVDGQKWGRDIPGGWVVPLWNPNADALIYPRPHLTLRLEGDPNGKAESVVGRLARPDQLVFYTSTSSDLDDRTDFWPAVLDVDYVDEESPVPPKTPAMNQSAPDAPLPPQPAVARGYERVTFALEPVSGVNLVHARSGQPITALMHNVTLMRAAPNRKALSQPMASGLAAIAAIVDKVSNAATVESAVEDLAGYQSRAKAKLADALADLTAFDVGTRFGIQPGQWPADEARLCAAVKSQAASRLLALKQEIVDIYDRAMAELLDQLATIAGTPVVEIKGRAKAAARSAFEVVELAPRIADTGLGSIHRQAEAARDSVLSSLDDMQRELDARTEEVRGGLRRLAATADNDIAAARSFVDSVQRNLNAAGTRIRAAALDLANGPFGKLSAELATVAATAEGGLQTLLAAVRNELSTAPISGHLRTIEGTLLSNVHGNIAAVVAVARGQVLSIWQRFDDAQSAVAAGPIAALRTQVENARKAVIDEIDSLADPTQVRAKVKALLEAPNQPPRQALQAILASVEAARHTAETQIGILCAAAFQTFADWKNALVARATELVNALNGDIDALAGQIEDVQRDLARALAPVADAVRRLDGEIRQGLQELGRIPSLQDPGETLRLIRAVGDAPVLPNLDFNLARVPYFFDDLEAAVRTSPMAALVDRLGDDLKALGIRLPTDRLLDRIVPASLQDFDIGKIFPDLGGLKLDNLFKGFKSPISGNDRVRLTQGFDKTNQTGWVRVDVDMPLEKSMDVLSIGPLRVRLRDGRFTALTELTARLGGGVKRTAFGKILGDWEMTFGGTPIVSFDSTSLQFDGGGKFDFDISADRVRLNQALRFLSDIVQSFSDPRDGFTVELTERNGIPTGVRGVLDMPLPPMGGGAFALSGLRLGAFFGLNVEKTNGALDFSFSIGAALGRKTRPFALTICFLSGGGWIEVGATYHPNSGALDASVTIGLVAGAAAEFAFGPAYGGVYIYFGIFVEYHRSSRTGGGGGLTLGVTLLIGGAVTLLSIVTIGISLLLEAAYDSTNGSMTGRGTLSASVRICWCVTINVSTSVTYQFAGDQPPNSANHYQQFE